MPEIKILAKAWYRAVFRPELQTTPLISEQGYSGFEAVGWIGIAAPARTPEPILKTLQAEIAKLSTGRR